MIQRGRGTHGGQFGLFIVWWRSVLLEHTVHGEPRILDAAGEGLRHGSGKLAPSRRVLSEDGNCPSATILFVVDAVWSELESSPGRNIVAVSFGPGLALYAALLRTT
jgi:predicted naringenin-chalcone synthase